MVVTILADNILSPKFTASIYLQWYVLAVNL